MKASIANLIRINLVLQWNHCAATALIEPFFLLYFQRVEAIVMQEQPNPPTSKETHVTPASNLPFLQGHAFPANPAGAQPSEPVTRTPSRRLFSHVILPLCLFVGMVAGIAWVSQYVPWRGPSKQETRPPDAKPCLAFEYDLSTWDIKDSAYIRGTKFLKNKDGEKELIDYVMEYEYMQGGSYEFAFTNVTDEEAEIGLWSRSCDCSSVDICAPSSQQMTEYLKWKAAQVDNKEAKMPDLPWQPLELQGTKGAMIPPRARGLARVTWAPRDQKKERLDIKLELWARPKGDSNPRKYTLRSLVQFVPSVRADIDAIKLAPVGARTSVSERFLCWTSTRPGAQRLVVREERDDPCFTFRVTKADDKRRIELLEKMWPTHHSLITTAWEVEVTVHEERSGKQMDMGSFSRRLNLYRDDDPEPQTGPSVVGLVSADVIVGSGLNEGKLNLGDFDVDKDTKHSFSLRTDPGVTLKYVEHFPSFLKVNLVRDAKLSTKNKDFWWLHVEVPKRTADNDFTGLLPAESSIVLSREREGSPPRRIRLQLEGTAAVRGRR
jgi:hypothetical protein